MRYQPTAAWLGVFVLMLVVASADIVHSAPRRPSNSASACSISADKFNQLAAKNPSGAQPARTWLTTHSPTADLSRSCATPQRVRSPVATTRPVSHLAVQ